MRRAISLVLLMIWAGCGTRMAKAAEPPEIQSLWQAPELQVTSRGRPLFRYVTRDEKIPRPYFHQIRTLDGVQVTRNHPPVDGMDAVDHDTFHPGIWLAFGDISGADFWRNKARVEHAKFLVDPRHVDDALTFTVLNLYRPTLAADEARVLCREECRYTVRLQPGGYLLTCESTFTSDADFTFGDQEEMGLGIRMATPLTVKAGGEIVNSRGEQNEKGTWGKTADWCDYRGVRDGRRVGIMVMPDPQNFRPAWFHSRDYGFIAANPFGRQAFTKGEKSVVTVRAGEPFHLGYGLFIHSTAATEKLDLDAVYKDYVGRVARAK